IHSADMGMEDILKVRGVPSDLRIKIDTTSLKAPRLQDDEHGLGQLIYIHRELIGVPSVLVIAPIGIYASKEVVVRGHLEFVLKGMLGEGGMVHLDVEFEIIQEVIFGQETKYGRCIKIILVFGRFHRLGFYEKSTFEALFSGIVLRHVQK